ncbi:MAG: sigma 54 modulation protein / ribosomal protein [Actinomycetia bacterium]|nr:sigma 54 modulation protein / ribosomal protein [Actinomycetes bacterium]
MDVSVSSRNIELTDALRSAAEEKIGRLGRFLEGMDRAEVHFIEEKNPRIADKKDVCEVTMAGHGHHVRVKVASTDPFTAIDLAVNKLEHQLHKLKTKLVSRNHPRKDRVGTDPVDDIDGLDVEVDGEAAESDRIVKSKAFVMKPMSPEEAVLQMDLLGHDFFFFSNADTGKAGVVYRRRSGDIGLIDEAG